MTFSFFICRHLKKVSWQKGNSSCRVIIKLLESHNSQTSFQCSTRVCVVWWYACQCCGHVSAGISVPLYQSQVTSLQRLCATKIVVCGIWGLFRCYKVNNCTLRQWSVSFKLFPILLSVFNKCLTTRDGHVQHIWSKLRCLCKKKKHVLVLSIFFVVLCVKKVNGNLYACLWRTIMTVRSDVTLIQMNELYVAMIP